MDLPRVNQPPARVLRSPEKWQAIVAQFEASGMTRRAFCQQAGICYGTFSRWRQRLMAANAQQPLTAPDTSLFVELSGGDAPPTASPSWDVELQLGADVFLRLRHQPC
jgi:transposase-like protein